jgi:IS1 family transposase
MVQGLGIRATARVFEMEPNPVLQWLVEAAEHLHAFSASFLCDMHLNQWQLDAWYAMLRGVKAGELSAKKAIKRLERSRHWGWTAIDPESKLLVAIEIGPRTLAMAQQVVHQGTEVLAPGGAPLLLTDGLKAYATALLTHFGQWMQPERRQERGPKPQQRWIPLPALRYAPVVQSYRRRRLVGGTHRVVFGTPLAIAQVLAACGWTINTACVERLHLDIRQRVAAIGRRVNTLCQGAGSFSFRSWDCTIGGKRVQGFTPQGALLSRHAPHELKPCTQVHHHDNTASAPHRGLRRHARLSPSSGQTPSLACHALPGLLCDVVWLSQL